MDPRRTDGIKACLFDAYGTLFDVAAAAREMAGEIGPTWQPLADTWRAKQLGYSWLRSLMGAHVDFWQVTADALDFAMAEHRIAGAGLRQRLLDIYFRLPCYPEVPDVLAALKQADLRTAILSNGSPAMLAAAIESSGLGNLIDMTISVEEVGIFKPDPRVYRRACDRLDLQPAQIAFHSSNGWDIHAGRRAGFLAIWINRSNQPVERLPDPPDVTLASLAEIPTLLGTKS